MAPKRRPKHPTRRQPLEPLHPTLDLHGQTADEARLTTVRWLGQQQGFERTVRVITGRGLHSSGPPVLRGEIEHLLTSLKGSVVSSFSVESGGGAFLIELRRAPPRSRPTVEPSGVVPPADPVLRREAEEALGELGIEPREPLVRAEMRRIARERKGGAG